MSVGAWVVVGAAVVGAAVVGAAVVGAAVVGAAVVGAAVVGAAVVGAAVVGAAVVGAASSSSPHAAATKSKAAMITSTREGLSRCLTWSSCLRPLRLPGVYQGLRSHLTSCGACTKEGRDSRNLTEPPQPPAPSPSHVCHCEQCVQRDAVARNTKQAYLACLPAGSDPLPRVFESSGPGHVRRAPVRWSRFVGV